MLMKQKENNALKWRWPDVLVFFFFFFFFLFSLFFVSVAWILRQASGLLLPLLPFLDLLLLNPEEKSEEKSEYMETTLEMFPLSSWMRATLSTMLLGIRDWWFSFTCWISTLLRSSTDWTWRKVWSKEAHTWASHSSGKPSCRPSSLVVVVVVVVVVAEGLVLDLRRGLISAMVGSGSGRGMGGCRGGGGEEGKPRLKEKKWS